MTTSQTIESLTKEILVDNDLFALPVDLERVADIFNINIIKSDPGDDDLSGALIREIDNTTILLNSKHHPNRNRYTLAHEYGHYFLHKSESSFVDGKKTQILLRSNNGIKSDMEREANQFAACLLMPLSLIEEEMHKINNEDIVEQLSKLFKVSQAAMGFRLINLGYTF